MSTLWFKRWGWIYRPVHPVGFVVVVAALAFVVNTLVVVDRQSHSASDTLYHAYVFIMPTFLALMWIAARTSAEARRSE